MPGRPAGSVMTVDFELDGLALTALNGGPVFTFNEAVSFQIICENQKEVDSYWDELTAGVEPRDDRDAQDEKAGFRRTAARVRGLTIPTNELSGALPAGG